MRGIQSDRYDVRRRVHKLEEQNPRCRQYRLHKLDVHSSINKSDGDVVYVGVTVGIIVETRLSEQSHPNPSNEPSNEPRPSSAKLVARPLVSGIYEENTIKQICILRSRFIC